MQKRTHGPMRIAALGRPLGVLTLGVFLGGCAQPPTEPEIDPEPQANTAPTASAGPDITASAGIPVRLSGTGSDADGDALTYAWTLVAPAGSDATLDDATSPTPAFTPDLPGEYGVTLVVNDGTAESAPDAATITAEDNTTVATIGPTGGEATSRDGDVTFRFPPGSLGADARISLTPFATSQLPALGAELEDRLGGAEAPVAFSIRIGDSDTAEVLSLPGTITWTTETESEVDSAGIAVPEIMYSDGEDAEPLAEQRTEVDLDDGRIFHSGILGTGGFVAFVPGQLDLTVVGFVEEVEVGETFTATLIGGWVGDGPGPEEVEVETVAEGAVSRTSPATAAVRVDPVGGAFVTDFEYVCEVEGAGLVTLRATSLPERGAPTEEGRFPSSIQKTVGCVPTNGGGEGLPLGLHELPDLNDIEAVSTIGRRLGSIDNAAGDAVLFSGKEGFQLRGLSDNRVIVDGIVVGSTNPLTRVMAVSRPDPGPDTPAAVFGSGVDFANALNPMGGWGFDYDRGTGTFSGAPAESPGAYWDAQTAGGMITDEIVAATNYGVDFLQWDGSTWSHELDARLPLDRYGIARNLGIGSVAAAEAGGPLLVAVGYHSGDPGRLFFDDRSDDDPIDVGELGVSPAMIRCAVPVCVSVQARDHMIRAIKWDGTTEPTIVGDPIPVGLDPGAVAVWRVTEGLTLVATFTGWTDDDVTLTELDDDATEISSTTMDLRALGCRGPRNGDWLTNPLDPNDPYLVIGCYDSNNYYVTKRSPF